MRIMEITPGQRKPIKVTLDTEEKFSQFWDKTIEPNCSEVLKVYRSVGKVYLRGEKAMADIFRGASRVNRPARDSNQLLAHIFDNCLLDLGFDARRSNSIFASGSRFTASDFGLVYIIFPINGFKFTYINQEDLVLDSFRDVLKPGVYDRIQMSFGPWAAAKNITPVWQYWGPYYLRKPTSLDQIIADLKANIPNDSFVQNLTPDTLFDCEYIAQRYQPSETDLASALTNNYETLFKCSYYAMAFDRYFKQANKKLGFPIKQ